MIGLLAAQHAELLRLCADPTARDVLVAALSRHLSAEEQYLYPALRSAVPGGDELADRELAADRELLLTLARDGVTPAAVEAVRRHVRAAAEDLLPLLEQMVPAEDLVRLGNRVEVAEEAAPTRPHPRTPDTPPWNKVVDPVLGVLDKARDALTGRTTYVNDLQ